MGVARSRLAQTRHGPVQYADVGTGPSVLMLHGGMGGYDMGLAWGERLVDRFRVISVSRPGYLRTPLLTGASLEQQANVLAALLDTLELASAAVFAHSAGAPTAITLAGRYPDRVWGLIVESGISRNYKMPQGKRPKGLWFLDSRQRARLIYMRLRPKPYLKVLLRSVSTFDQRQLEALSRRILLDSDRYRFFLAVKHATHPTRHRWVGRQNDHQNLSCLENLPYGSISAPTLICHGRRDADVMFSHAEFAMRSIDDAELLICENGSHLLPLGDDWPALLGRQSEFLAEHAPT